MAGDSNKKLTHLDDQGRARMVDVSAKQDTLREAVAEGCIRMSPETLELILTGGAPKGDVFGVARVAGIMAAKRTAELIPLCHQVSLTSMEVSFLPQREQNRVTIRAVAGTTGKTGVEMEALSAVAAAGLTIYDMCKAVDRSMTISDIRLIKKTGGRSGTFERKEHDEELDL